MSTIGDFMKKIVHHRMLYIQLLFTVFTFFLMVVLSNSFVSRIVQDDMLRSTDTVLDLTEAQINSELLKIQLVFKSYAQNMRSMIIEGDDAGILCDYNSNMSRFLHSMDNLPDVKGPYGYIEEMPDGPVTLLGIEMSSLPDSLSSGSPLYEAAVAAGGNIVETAPYTSASGRTIITYLCALYDDKGGYMGVVCLDVPILYLGRKSQYSFNKRRLWCFG